MAFSFLKTILDDRLCSDIYSTCSLRERDKSAKLKKVNILGISKNAFLLKLDRKRICNLFDCRVENINKMCDYAIFIEESDNKINVLLCELKTGKPKPKDFVYQLANGEKVIEFIFSIIALEKTNITHNVDKVLFCNKYKTSFYNKGQIYSEPKKRYEEETSGNTKIRFLVKECTNDSPIHINNLIR